MGSVRRECLDHVLIVSEAQLLAVLTEYRRYYNRSRPHQGIGQHVPEGSGAGEKRLEFLASTIPSHGSRRVVEIPMVGGLHHAYRLTA